MSNPNADTQKRVQALSAAWRNYVADALGLDKATFQFAQGSLGLQTADSSGLWLIADSVPPESPTHYFDAGGFSRWSKAYGNLLFSILPEEGSDLRQKLGDNYTSWNDYAIKNGRGLKAFKAWATDNLGPAEQVKTIAVYTKAALTPWSKASEAYLDAANRQKFPTSDNKNYSLYRYHPSIEDVQPALNGSGPRTVDFEYSTAEDSSQETSVEGAAAGLWDIFAGDAEGSFHSLNTKASEAKFSVSGTIKQSATLAVRPGEWFDPAEVHRAYASRGDFRVWDQNSNSGNWESFFGPDGSLARRVSQIVLVSGYDITVTSHASYTEDDVQKIKASASVGVWPFFCGEVHSSHETTLHLNSQSQLEMSFKLPVGKNQIWGVTVEDTE